MKKKLNEFSIMAAILVSFLFALVVARIAIEMVY